LITDKLFLEQIVDILDEKYTSNDAFRWLIKEIREYYNEYKDVITMNVFKIKIQEIDSDLLQVNVKDVLKEVFKNMESADLDYVKDKSLDFHKSQVLKDAIIRSAEILEREGDSDEIKSLIDTAMQAGVERNLGHEYLQDIEERYSETARITSPTPWDIMNELMQGGLGDVMRAVSEYLSSISCKYSCPKFLSTPACIAVSIKLFISSLSPSRSNISADLIIASFNTCDL
jgi:hypothetical protein